MVQQAIPYRIVFESFPVNANVGPNAEAIVVTTTLTTDDTNET
jgi:hypothetical protein